MENFNYDSYCGIYCGACDIMMTYKTGKKHKLSFFWNESTIKTFQKKIGINYDETKPFTYKCHGCKTDTLFVNCSVCQIRKCAINNKIDHCIDCQKYPCNLIVDARKLESLLPHLKSNHSSMVAINKVGIAQWLSEQEKKWECPNCHTGFSWYTKRCKKCEEDLKDNSLKLPVLKLLIMKIGIHAFMRKQT